jgi:hypothetical protein
VGFTKGDSVRVASDNYAEPGQSLTGTTGTVAGTGPGEAIAVHTDDGRSLGFYAEELERR